MTPLPSGSVAVILPAAGSGRRFGEQANKLFAMLAGRPLWTYAVETLSRRTEVGVILLAVASCDRSQFQAQSSFLSLPERVQFVAGGEQRSDSVAAAIEAIDAVAESASPSTAKIQWVAIHDAARPLLRDADVTAVFERAAQSRAAILATPVTGTLKRAQPSAGKNSHPSCQTVDRRGMWSAQTPQVFGLDLIRQAYARHRGRTATDDAELVERLGHPVALVQGAADNLKITYPEDLLLAEALMSTAAWKSETAPVNPVHET